MDKKGRGKMDRGKRGGGGGWRLVPDPSGPIFIDKLGLKVHFAFSPG